MKGPTVAVTRGSRAFGRGRVLLLLLIGMTAAAPWSAVAQIPQGFEGAFRPAQEADRAISSLLSPFCPGLMLEVCPSGEAVALRDSIQALALEGWPADSLVAWMLASHGEQYRAIPQSRGAGLWAWVIPPLALAMGLFAVFRLLRRLRAPRREDGDPGHELSPEEEERLRSALRELDASEEPA